PSSTTRRRTRAEPSCSSPRCRGHAPDRASAAPLRDGGRGMKRIVVFLATLCMVLPAARLAISDPVRGRHPGPTGASVHSDFNGDGFADLAIGVSSEDVGTIADAGAVNVLYGSAAGLQATGAGGPDGPQGSSDGQR